METTEPQTPASQPSGEQAASGDLKQLLETARAEWKPWLGTAAVALVLAAGIFLYKARSQSNEEQASRMLGEARSGQALQSLMSQYPRTAAARLALLQFAKMQYDAGDYVAALSSYTDFISRNPSHLMVPAAEMGKIHCQEAMGQTADALNAYSAFANSKPDHYLAPMALFGKARCLQRLDHFDDARAIYEDFLVAHPDTPWKGEIEESLRDIAREKRKADAAAAKPTVAAPAK